MLEYSEAIVYFDIYLQNLIPYATNPANSGRAGLSSSQVTELGTFPGFWNPSFSRYLSPLTFGKLSSAEINSLYKKYKKYTDGLKQQVKKNPSAKLNELDYIMYDIHKDLPARKDISKPDANPSVTLKRTTHLNNKYHVSDLENPSKPGKPKDTKRVKVVMLILPANAPAPTLAMLKPEMETGLMNFDIPFLQEDEGKVAYIAVCFSNNSGDSNYSAILKSYII